MVREAVFSVKADCSLVGPFAGSYEQGWGLEYDSPDNTLWLTRGKGFRNQLVQAALGYRINGEARAAAPWYITLENSGRRQLRIAAYASGESEPQLIGVFAQKKSLTISCPNAVTEEKLQSAIPELERIAQTAIVDGRTPGLVIRIVYRGRVVYLNGFGLREVGRFVAFGVTIYRVTRPPCDPRYRYSGNPCRGSLTCRRVPSCGSLKTTPSAPLILLSCLALGAVIRLPP